MPFSLIDSVGTGPAGVGSGIDGMTWTLPFDTMEVVVAPPVGAMKEDAPPTTQLSV
jgi:hypothetical protein